MDANDIKRRLRSINWNFDFYIPRTGDSLYPFDCRKHYSYPATFIPEIPYSLIETLSKKGDVVLDPFGGVGTTFIQALLLERSPFTIDINPVATNVCAAIYELFNPDLDMDSLEKELLDICNDYEDSYDYTLLADGYQKELREWYEEKTYNKICFLISCYNTVQDRTKKIILRLLISGCLVTLSSQNKGWAYIADNVKPKEDEYKSKPVFELYKTRTRLLFSEVNSHLKNCSSSFSDFYSKTLTEQRIFTGSVADIKIPSVNLIITSPPYPKMIDYVKSQRMTFGFLNKAYQEFVPREIGARCRRTQKRTLENYLESMNTINERLSSSLKPDGFLCLILPDYPNDDQRRGIIDEMIRSYESFGLKPFFEYKRYIPSHRRTISFQWANLVNEKLLIFQKEK